MSQKKWTLLLLGDSPEGVRQFSISPRLIRWVAGGIGAISLITAVLFGLLLFNGAAQVRAAHLARENALLSEELDRFRDRVTSFEETLAHLTEQDGRVRQLAGLDVTDEDILEVGIGGPGLASPERRPLWSLDSELGETAFAVEYDLGALERRARLLAASLSEATDSLSAHRDLLESTPSILPVAGVLSSRFSASRIHPIHHVALPHEGIDVSAPKGTPILAAANGRIVYAGRKNGWGYTVEIDHGHGYLTRYAHASRILVRRGQTVNRGEVIAHVGSTGISNAPHLHYEIRIGGVAVNPLNYVIAGVLP
jgi:murein DD-endopeptidase MepM/ murein hydrolase activator NlpD